MPVKNERRKLFFGLFVFPLLIAVCMAALLCIVVFMTHEEETPETLITAIKSGAPSKRWQKAFELSNELNRPSGMIRKEGIRNEVAHILGDPEHYDAKTRSYMALALSRFKTPETNEVLRTRLKEEEPEVQLHLLWALGNADAREAIRDVETFFTHESADLRKMSSYIAGILGDAETVNRLKPLLDDAAADVSWNAALALARLGDDSGWKVLIKMLDRNILAQHFQLNEEQAQTVMVNALKGLGQLKRPDSLSYLQTLSKEDKNLKVRQAALEALQKINSTPGSTENA